LKVEEELLGEQACGERRTESDREKEGERERM
jgi:hypothetical protein